MSYRKEQFWVDVKVTVSCEIELLMVRKLQRKFFDLWRKNVSVELVYMSIDFMNLKKKKIFKLKLQVFLNEVAVTLETHNFLMFLMIFQKNWPSSRFWIYHVVSLHLSLTVSLLLSHEITITTNKTAIWHVWISGWFKKSNATVFEWSKIA